MKRETFEFEGMPYKIVRLNGGDKCKILNKDDLCIGFLDTSTSKQSMSTEYLELVLADRAYVIEKLLKIAEVKL